MKCEHCLLSRKVVKYAARSSLSVSVFTSSARQGWEIHPLFAYRYQHNTHGRDTRYTLSGSLFSLQRPDQNLKPVARMNGGEHSSLQNVSCLSVETHFWNVIVELFTRSREHGYKGKIMPQLQMEPRQPLWDTITYFKAKNITRELWSSVEPRTKHSWNYFIKSNLDTLPCKLILSWWFSVNFVDRILARFSLDNRITNNAAEADRNTVTVVCWRGS